MLDGSRLESVAKYGTIIGALVAASVGIGQCQRGVAQSVKELEWKQAEMARTMVGIMLKDEGWDAMTMLDWKEGRIYEIAPGINVRILPGDVGPALEAALRTEGPKRTETQRFIGDRYDRFLFLVGQLQAAVRSGLVRKADIEFPLSWYVEKRLCGHRKLLLAYIAVNNTPYAAQYFESLDAWQRCVPSGSS